MSTKLYVGIDIGGTTAKIGLVDEQGNIIEKAQQKTLKVDDWKLIIEEFLQPLDEWIKDGHEIQGIGVAGPGAFDKNKRMLATSVNIPALKDAPIIKYIEKKYATKAVGDNDATCAAVGERIFGAGKEYENYLFVTIGTGIGGGLILNNQVFRGRDGFAGEFGHVTAVPDGLLCSCGNHGCIEAYSSATAIIKNITQGIERGTIDSYNNIPPEHIDAKMIFEKAKDGDFASINAIENAARHLGTVIGSTINLLNLDAIILGGGVAQAAYFVERLKFHIAKTAWPSFMKNLQIIPAKLLNDAGILGAASLVIDDFANQGV